MPAVEVLVLAGVLAEMTGRPGPDPATQNACRWWSAQLARLLNAASAATAATIGQQPTSSTGPGLPALQWAA